MNDTEMLDRVQHALSTVRMDVPADLIMRRGHARRTRRAIGLTGVVLATTATLVVALVAIGTRTAPPPTDPTGARLAAFTVVKNTDGTATLTLIKGRPLDANALRAKLADADVPAVVTVGRSCDTHPEPSGLDQVVSAQRRIDGTVTLTIAPAKMPLDSELSIGVFSTHKTWALITTGLPLICTSQ
jgi:hypothetical protein